MDKRAKLLSDLSQLCSNASGSSSDTHFRDVHSSDLEMSSDDEGAHKCHAEDNESDFSDDGSDSDDDLEAHLRLLRPRELEALGIDSLRNQQFEAAVKYLNLARLDWTEALVKRSLESGGPAELSRDNMADDWIISKYIHLAVCRSPFVERELLSAEYEAMVAKCTKNSGSTASAGDATIASL